MYVEECVINKNAKIHEKAMTLELGKIPLSSLRIFFGIFIMVVVWGNISFSERTGV